MSQICLTLAAQRGFGKMTNDNSNSPSNATLPSYQIWLVTPREDEPCFLTAPPTTTTTTEKAPPHAAWPHLAERNGTGGKQTQVKKESGKCSI